MFNIKSNNLQYNVLALKQLKYRQIKLVFCMFICFPKQTEYQILSNSHYLLFTRCSAT